MVALGDFASDGETESRTPGLPGPGIVQPGESLEDTFPVLHGDARTVVVHGEDHLGADCADGYLGPGGPIAGGVVEQVAQ